MPFRLTAICLEIVLLSVAASSQRVSQTAPAPNRNIGAVAAHRPPGGNHPETTAGTIEGFVYWDANSISHNPASSCSGLAITVGVGSSSGGPFTTYTPLQTLSNNFKYVGRVKAFAYGGKVSVYDVCTYGYDKVPVGPPLQVKLTVAQPTVFSPTAAPQSAILGPITIINAQCNMLPRITNPTAGDLTAHWGACQNMAYGVNFFLIHPQISQTLSSGGGSGGMQGGPSSGMLLKQTSPAGMLRNPSSASTRQSPSGGMLVPAVTPAPAQAPANSAPSMPGQLLPAKPGPGSTVQLNPQPLPPKGTASTPLTGGNTVQLNPQPLPPRATNTLAASAGSSSQPVAGRVPAVTAPALAATGQTSQNPGGVSSKIPNSDLSALNAARRANMLKGFVDLHTHPLSNLAFGGKLVYGGVDVGSLLPADPNCNHNVRATSMPQALGHDNSTHGGWGTDNGCGDSIRSQVIHALQQANKAADPPDDAYGANGFKDWPLWNDITHQKMWVDWIYRSYQGGLRVMVALAVNNKTLGDATAGPGDYATDDKSSADLQIRETKAFVQRHANFMEVAYSSADVERIIKSNKLAVVLGVEIDDIGDLNTVRNLGASNVTAEIDRLYSEGVRYIFPIHVIDNPFGGTAVYEGAFNMSNYHITGNFWSLECANPADGITYQYQPDGFDVAVALVKATKLGIDVFRNPPDPPNCPAGDGDENTKGLTRLGEFAIKEMMRHGMLIDIDHMSQKSANRALDIAEGAPTSPLGYPLFSGHNTPRGLGGDSENQRTSKQYARIAKLGGMAGVGTAGRDAYEWLHLYQMVVQSMHQQSEALGTDINGLVKGMPPRQGSHISYSPFLPKSSLGGKQWDYNTDGVVHYGMLPEFLMDAKTGPSGTYLIDNNLMYGAETFFEAWQKCESLKSKVN